MFQFNFGKLIANHARHFFMPQKAAFHDIALFRRGQLFAALHRQITGNTGNALNLISFINLRIDAASLAIAQIFNAARLAEIDPTGQFADNHNIQPLDQLAFQAGGIGQSGETNGRTQIGKKLQIGAQAQQPCFGARLIGDIIPLRAADRAQQNRIRVMGFLHGGIGYGLPMRVIGAAADQIFIERHLKAAPVTEPVNNAAHFAHHFRTNAVARQYENFFHYIFRFKSDG
ncbi:MAG: Uncharacterised protein [Alphaproteobacteria bacterium]|nr:MAG: Uncharacterised protein [Alphaproteobacteria bacterium]